MAVKIKLARLGKIREPFYRVVVADSHTRRSGRAIETIGKYHPKAEPSLIEIDSDRALYWLGVGAQPTEPVLALLKVTGDWQKFRGLPGAEGTLKPQPVKVGKKSRYDAAVAAAGGTVEDTSGATTPKRRPARKSDGDSVGSAAKAPAAEPAVATEPAAAAEPAVAAEPAAAPSGSAASAAPQGGAGASAASQGGAGASAAPQADAGASAAPQADAGASA